MRVGEDAGAVTKRLRIAASITRGAASRAPAIVAGAGPALRYAAMGTSARKDEVRCRLGIHATVPFGDDAICPRCGLPTLRWVDVARDVSAAPARPVDLRWSEIDGGTFFLVSYAREHKKLKKNVITFAAFASLCAWALAENPKTTERVVALALIVVGAVLVYVGWADAHAQVVVRLDAQTLRVRRAPRLVQDESIALEHVRVFAAEVSVSTAPEGGSTTRHVVQAIREDDGVLILDRLALESHAEAAYVAHRLSHALTRLRHRARGAALDRAPDDPT